MLLRKPLALAALLCAASSPHVWGHGTPIELTQIAGVLSVSHPVDNYPPFVFGQQDEEADPQGPLSLPGIGSALLWGLPGIDIAGIDESASLSLQVLALPGPGDAASPLRFWSRSSRTVAQPHGGVELDLLLGDGSFTPIRAADNQAPAAALLAATLADQVGYHNHGLVNYAMPYRAAIPQGIYGFFGRITSNQYAASQTLLVLFNLGADYADLAPASEALWASAFPGDYDHSGMVDAQDYEAWRLQYGEEPLVAGAGADGNADGVIDAADYTVWRDNLAPLHPGAAFTAPTPGAASLAALAVVAMLLTRRRP